MVVNDDISSSKLHWISIWWYSCVSCQTAKLYIQPCCSMLCRIFINSVICLSCQCEVSAEYSESIAGPTQLRCYLPCGRRGWWQCPLHRSSRHCGLSLVVENSHGNYEKMSDGGKGMKHAVLLFGDKVFFASCLDCEQMHVAFLCVMYSHCVCVFVDQTSHDRVAQRTWSSWPPSSWCVEAGTQEESQTAKQSCWRYTNGHAPLCSWWKFIHCYHRSLIRYQLVQNGHICN